MISKRPVILIYTNQPDPDFLRQICAGIEEEGVFYRAVPKESESLDTLAYEAANDSMLGSGIGVSGVDIALQLRGLRKGQNVKAYHMPTFEQCRCLGADSARAVKRTAFKMFE